MRPEYAPPSSLPVIDSWFRSRPFSDRVVCIDEPAVNEFLRANIWHVRGRDRDLVVDAGLGVASLRQQLPQLFENDPVLIITHAHLDHAGSAHEFEDKRMHAAELIRGPLNASLFSDSLLTVFGMEGLQLPEILIDAVPSEDYDPRTYSIPPLQVTTELQGGDVIDLGDRKLTVLHLPGHTPGSICLFNEHNGELFSGDVVYDDLLLDELHESNIDDYVASMLSLRTLAPTRVYPGHGDPFDGDRMLAIIDAYLAKRAHP